MSNIGQYRKTNTRNRPGNTTRDTLSISRHMIRSTPVSMSVQATDRIDCRRLDLVGPPPLPCSDVWVMREIYLCIY